MNRSRCACPFATALELRWLPARPRLVKLSPDVEAHVREGAEQAARGEFADMTPEESDHYLAQLFDAPHELLAFHFDQVALSRSSLRGVAPGERLAGLDELGDRIEEVQVRLACVRP